MTTSNINNQEPWTAILISDARAAMRAAGRLRGATRQLDGPFAYWDGKLQGANIPVSIWIPSPGGASAWYAATLLVHRRCAPSWIVGFTPMTWISDNPAPEVLIVAETVELRFSPRGNPMPDGLIGGKTGPSRKAGDWLRRNFTHSPSGKPEKRVAFGRVGCCNSMGSEARASAQSLVDNLTLDALDEESMGLAEAASELNIPWSVIGLCTRRIGDGSFLQHFKGLGKGKTAAPSSASLDDVVGECMEMIAKAETFPV